MKKLLFILWILCFTQSQAQVVCVLNGHSFSVSSNPLFTYPFPSDTTEYLLTNTYLSITPDSLYYADVLSYKNNCNSFFLIKAAFKDLQHNIGFQIEEIVLNEKKKIKGYLLTVYTSIGHNVFILYQESVKYGATAVNGNMVSIICDTKESANSIKNEIEKMLKEK